MDGRQSTHKVHSLVLLTFSGPKPEACEACHQDGDPTNNCLTNLYWGSRSENQKDRIRHRRHNKLKLTASEVFSIREQYAAGGVTQQKLAELFGVTQYTISDIVRGKTW